MVGVEIWIKHPSYFFKIQKDSGHGMLWLLIDEYGVKKDMKSTHVCWSCGLEYALVFGFMSVRFESTYCKIPCKTPI